MARHEPELMLQRQRMAMIGAVAGAVLMFIVVDIIGELFKIALGAGVGAAIGVLAWAQFANSRRHRRSEELQDSSKADLEKQAKRLSIPVTASMTKADLADAIASKMESADQTGEMLIDTVAAVGERLGEKGGQVKERLLGTDNRAYRDPYEKKVAKTMANTQPDLARVPVDNQPGHHPDQEQDKPDLDAFAAKLAPAGPAPAGRSDLDGTSAPEGREAQMAVLVGVLAALLAAFLTLQLRRRQRRR